MGVGRQRHTSAASGKRHGTDLYRGLGGPQGRSGMGAEGLVPTGIWPLDRPACSYAVPVHCM